MHKTKLFKLIKSLSKKEFNQLEAYIDSPFFLKKNKNPLKLYLALAAYAPKFDSNELTKEVIFKAVYPNVNYNDGKMRNLLSRTVKIVDNYLLYLDNEEDEFGRDKRLSEVYNKRNIESEFFNYSRRLLAELEKVEQKDTAYYFNKFSLEKELYFHIENNRKNSNELLKNTIYNFQNYLGLEQAIFLLEITNKKQMFKDSINLPTIRLSKEIVGDNLNLLLLNQINQLLIKKDIHLYIRIIADFESNINKLGDKDSMNIYTAIQNFGVREVNKNFKIYGPILFKVYQIGLANNMLLLNGVLIVTSYLNIVIVGLKLENFEWVASFINDYEHLLPPKNAESIKQYSLCNYFFITGEHQKVIEITNSNRFNDIKTFRLISAKTFQIRSIFHLLETDISFYKLLLNKCAAFDKYIEREKSLLKNRKIRYKKFTTLLRKMAHAIKNDKWNAKKKKILKTELKNEKNIRFRDWFLERLNE